MTATAIELFAGAGGSALGAHYAGFDTRVAVELDPAKAWTFARNHPDTYVLGLPGASGDVRQVSGRKLLRIADLKGRRLDLLVACPPCQGFSTKGKRDSKDKRNTLYLEFVRLVREISPRAVVFENVPGIELLYRGRFLTNLRRRLEDLGYKVDTWNLRACDMGVPQLRERIFVVGLSHKKPGRPPNKRKAVTVWEAISDLPVSKINPRRRNSNTAALRYRRSPSSQYSTILRGKNFTVTSCQTTAHAGKVVARFRRLGWQGVDTPTKHRRLHPKRASQTLTAGTRSMTALRPVHPYSDRVLTVREAARIMSFPDWYRFPSETAEAWSQIGNSVPPLMAKAVFARVKHFLERPNS